jgi:hypothetical protein
VTDGPADEGMEELGDPPAMLPRRGSDLVKGLGLLPEQMIAAFSPELTCSPRKAAPAVFTSTRQVHSFLPRRHTIAPSGITVLPSESLKRTSAKVSISGDLGAPSSLSSAWPNSGTARMTANSEEVARFSCSS